MNNKGVGVTFCLISEILVSTKYISVAMLNDLTSEKDYLSLYENKDKRIIWDDNQYLYIAATYLNNHDLNKAKEVIENRFGKKGLRKKYLNTHKPQVSEN